MIDREAAMPLYHQIYLQLRDEILGGQRPYGSAMPTEQELSDIYGVSRITARRVLSELAQQNYVERRRRLGTRVIFQSPTKPLEANIDQAIDSLLAFGRRTKVTVLDVTSQPPTAAVARAFGLGADDRVVRAVRVRSLDSEPLGYIVSYVRADLAAVVTARALARTPILKLLEDAGHRAGHAEQTISAVEADTTVARALGIETRAALLRIARTVQDADRKPFLLTFARYRADRFTIRLDLQHHGFALSPALSA